MSTKWNDTRRFVKSMRHRKDVLEQMAYRLLSSVKELRYCFFIRVGGLSMEKVPNVPNFERLL